MNLNFVKCMPIFNGTILRWNWTLAIGLNVYIYFVYLIWIMAKVLHRIASCVPLPFLRTLCRHQMACMWHRATFNRSIKKEPIHDFRAYMHARAHIWCATPQLKLAILFQHDGIILRWGKNVHTPLDTQSKATEKQRRHWQWMLNFEIIS